MKQIKLDSLEVQSFITTLGARGAQIKGGITGNPHCQGGTALECEQSVPNPCGSDLQCNGTAACTNHECGTQTLDLNCADTHHQGCFL